MSTKSASLADFQQKIANVLPDLTGYLFLLAVIAFILVILPLGQNFLLDSKQLLFFIFGLVIFAIWTINAFVKKTVQITLSAFILPALLFLVSTLISSFVNAVYPQNQLLGFGGAYIVFGVLVLLAPSLIPHRFSKYFSFVFVLAAALLALTGAAELMKVGPSLLYNAAFKLGLPSSPLFSLSGSSLVALQILFVALVGSLAMVMTAKKLVKPFFLLCAIVFLAGLIVNGRALWQQKILSDVLLPFGASWSVATDTLKSVKAALVGVGPESYQQTYLQYKPTWVNTTPVWNLQFNQGSNWPLTLIVTNGLLGLIAWAVLTVIVIQRTRKSHAETLTYAAMSLAILGVELLLPPNLVLIALQTCILVFWTVAEKEKLKDLQIHAFTVQLIKSSAEIQKVPKHSNFLVYAITGLSAVAIITSAWAVAKVAFADYYFFQALLGSARNDANQVYANQQKAIKMNPYSAEGTRTFANTNFTIAQALAQKNDATDADKQQIITFIQQSIQEAKNALYIEPQNSLNWVLLARIYNNIVGVADGADTTAITAYQQAIVYAPTDPTVNLELGSLYYRLGKYPQAVQQLEKTTQLKSDWANAFYNLANAYKQNKQLQQSYDAYQQTLLLLPSNSSSEYGKVKVEQDDVQKLLKALQAQSQQSQQKESTTSGQVVAPKTNQNKVKGVSTSAPSPTLTASPVASPVVSPTLAPASPVETAAPSPAASPVTP